MEVIESGKLNVFRAEDIKSDIDELIKTYSRGKVFLLMDTETYKFCYPLIKDAESIQNIPYIIIKNGEHNKNIETLGNVWHFLADNGADRKSLLINLAGGMPCDLGGFAASTYKRGIDFINIPTTLLSQVDAAVGGKIGVNFGGLKNQIGLFRPATAVIVDPHFTLTQDEYNINSGFAEMIKHALIYSKDIWENIKDIDLNKINIDVFGNYVINSINVKRYFVNNDPTEQNIRKALNFGHTVGHALESLALHNNTPILHGYAVAYGMMAELYLCTKICGFSEQLMMDICSKLTKIYGKFDITEDYYTELFELMQHDKKNEDSRINFTLLSDIGKVEINKNCNKQLIFESLDFYRNYK